MESYITVKKRSSFEYEDRKSIFIGEAMPIKNEAEAISFIEAVKKEYPDAKHHVYAYVLRENSIMRFTDDKEPQGTAGMPVLDCIRKNGLSDVCVVVTRYFGGTLLGTGGLVRAYTQAASGALNDAEIVKFDIYTKYAVVCNYADYQKILPLFANLKFRVGETRFTENVEIKGSILKSDNEEFEKKITEISSGRCKIEKLGDSYDF